jgi:thioredoxin 1
MDKKISIKQKSNNKKIINRHNMEGKMRSLIIPVLFGLLLSTGFAANASASEEHEEFLKNLPVKGTVTMIDLGKKNCTQCKMMAPILEKLKIKYEGKAEIVFINLMDDPEQQYRFKLKALPTQIFFNKEGKEIFRHTGFMAEKAIVEQLNKMGLE